MIVFQRYICSWALHDSGKTAQAGGSSWGLSPAHSGLTISWELLCPDPLQPETGRVCEWPLHLHSITADKTESKIHVRAPHQKQHERLLYSFTWYLGAFLRSLFNVSPCKRDYSLRLHSLRLFYPFPFICSFLFFSLGSTWRRITFIFQKSVVKIKKQPTWAWVFSRFIILLATVRKTVTIILCLFTQRKAKFASFKLLWNELLLNSCVSAAGISLVSQTIKTNVCVYSVITACRARAGVNSMMGLTGLWWFIPWLDLSFQENKPEIQQPVRFFM